MQDEAPFRFVLRPVLELGQVKACLHGGAKLTQRERTPEREVFCESGVVGFENHNTTGAERSSAQRTAVEQRPHQQSIREQVAKTERAL